MKTLFFSSDLAIVDEWKKKEQANSYTLCYDIESLQELLHANNEEEYIVVVDFDSVAGELNKLISANKLPEKTVVLEKVPEIASGKMLITHGVKAYANSRISAVNYKQMIQTVAANKIWTYPELTATLATLSYELSKTSRDLLRHRLSIKEVAVVYAILQGLTNDAIAKKLNITLRTVKAHISSIFSKLHINDRVSLVLLLK
jgi:DNA-binding NarL/FixJ family response regulator